MILGIFNVFFYFSFLFFSPLYSAVYSSPRSAPRKPFYLITLICFVLLSFLPSSPSYFQWSYFLISEPVWLFFWTDNDVKLKGIPKLGTALNGNAYFLLQVFHQTIVIFLTGDSSFLLFPLYCKDRTATQCLLNQAARAENLFLKQCVELAFLMCPEKSCLTSAIVIK